MPDFRAQNAPEASTAHYNPRHEKKKFHLSEWLGSFKKIDAETIAIFTRQFAILFKSGFTITRAVKMLRDQSDDRKFKGILTEIDNDICRKGLPLSTSVKKHGKAFPPYYAAMIKAGETSGALDKVLGRMAGTCEKEVKLAKQTTAALVYPFAVIFVSLLTITIIIKYVLPLFIPMLLQSNLELPLPTKILIFISNMLNNLTGIILLAFFASAITVILILYLKTKDGRLRFSLFALNLPVIGRAIKIVCVTRFCRTFAMLYSAGVPLMQNLSASKEVMADAFLMQEMDKVILDIPRVESFAHAFERSGIFPRAVTSMLSAGEQTGKVSESLTKISNFYEEEIEHTLNTLVTLIEPVLLIFLGVVVAFIMASVFVPLYDTLFKFSG